MRTYAQEWKFFEYLRRRFGVEKPYALEWGGWEKWDAQFNPGLEPSRATQSGWPVVLTVIFSLVLGAGVMMTFLAIAFEQFFISQLQEAKKLSQ